MRIYPLCGKVLARTYFVCLAYRYGSDARQEFTGIFWQMKNQE